MSGRHPENESMLLDSPSTRTWRSVADSLQAVLITIVVGLIYYDIFTLFSLAAEGEGLPDTLTSFCIIMLWAVALNVIGSPGRLRVPSESGARPYLFAALGCAVGCLGLMATIVTVELYELPVDLNGDLKTILDQMANLILAGLAFSAVVFAVLALRAVVFFSMSFRSRSGANDSLLHLPAVISLQQWVCCCRSNGIDSKGI